MPVKRIYAFAFNEDTPIFCSTELDFFDVPHGSPMVDRIRRNMCILRCFLSGKPSCRFCFLKSFGFRCGGVRCFHVFSFLSSDRTGNLGIALIHVSILGLLDERASPMIPTAMMTAKATLPTFHGGSNDGAKVASDNAFSCCIFRT